MTTAERIIDRLDWYERTHGDNPHISKEWTNFIWALAGKDRDEDGAQRSTIAVFGDGSAVRWLEDKRRWVGAVMQ